MTEWNAGDYYRRSGLQQVMAEEALGLLRLEGTETILDVDCGDGKITSEIAARLPHGVVLGVDSSYEMIAFASNHFGPPGHANLCYGNPGTSYVARISPEASDMSYFC